MKGIVISFIISLFLFGCSGQNPTDSNYSNFGEVKLAFKSSEIPSDVVLIKAILTSVGKDTIEKELDLSVSTSTELVIENIEPGNWNLAVEAYNSDGETNYTGTADIEIIADQITQVSIVLQRTNSGLGTVIINIVWVNPNSVDWSDITNNPLVVKADTGYYDSHGVWKNFVIQEDGIYKMWYSGLSANAVNYIYYATSEDGFNWKKYGGSPIFYPSENGAWDSWHVSMPLIIKKNNLYMMYYLGFSDNYLNWGIGLAVSADGINWERHGTAPLITGSSGDWDSVIYPCDIEEIDGKFYLYYTGKTSTFDYKVGVAVSEDGYTFSKYGDEPILLPSFDWEGDGISHPSIFKEGDKYYMVYSSVNSNISGFGIASSNDGLYWEKTQDAPFFIAEQTFGNYNRILYPHYLQTENRNFIYYTGEMADGNYSINAIIQNK